MSSALSFSLVPMGMVVIGMLSQCCIERKFYNILSSVGVPQKYDKTTELQE